MATEALPPAIGVLLAEHDLCRRRLEVAVAALEDGITGGAQAARIALAQAQSLLQFLEDELETHIAKEEGPLFPRLKGALPADDRLIDEMVAEHDLIRIKRDDVRTVLARLLDTHDDLRLDRDALRVTLAETISASAALPHIRDAVAVVSAKLRVHFENEEELVFPLAPELLSGDELERIAVEMTAIENGAAAV